MMSHASDFTEDRRRTLLVWTSMKEHFLAGLITRLSRDMLLDIVETDLNIIIGTNPTDMQQLASLHRHEQELLELTTPRMSLS